MTSSITVFAYAMITSGVLLLGSVALFMSMGRTFGIHPLAIPVSVTLIVGGFYLREVD